MAQSFHIDRWVADPDRNTFTSEERTVRVEPKVMEVCLRLAQVPGSVVSKTELLDSVWPDTTVGEDALTRAVSELRRAVEDDARHPRIIETIPKRGYRLIATVKVTTSEPAAGAGAAGPAHRASRPATLAASALGVLLIVAGLFWFWRPADFAPAAVPRIQVLVTAVNNHTDDSALGILLRRTVEQQLERDGDVGVVPDHRIASALLLMRRSEKAARDIDTAIEIAQRHSGIAAVVAGELHRTPGEYVLTLRIVNPLDSRVLRTAVARGAEQGLLLAATEREMAPVRGALQRFTPDPVDPLPAVTTSSLEALRFFAQGVAVADSAVPLQAGSWPKTLELFRKALQEDPDFAMAQAWLAMAMKFAEETDLANRGGTRDPAILFRQQALDSLTLTESGLISENERLFIQGVASMLLERHVEAIAAFETLLLTDSRFFEIRTRSFLASLYTIEGRWAERGAQLLKLAELLPNDVDANVAAAEVLIAQDDGAVRRASAFAERAKNHVVPEIAQRDNSCWSVAWLEHLTVYEDWARGEITGAVMKQHALAALLDSRVSFDRDAMATSSGYLWLTLGRLDDARKAFEAVGHEGQRELNLALLADLRDDRLSMLRHLKRLGWAYNPVLFARAGLFERARRIMQEPTVGAHPRARNAIAEAESALSEGRLRDAIALLQPALEMLRARPQIEFYNASLSLARAWNEAGSPSQAVRVLEEAASARPAYVAPGLAGAWWIKTQARLADAYREAGRVDKAIELEARIRALLAHADPGYPFVPQIGLNLENR